MSAEAVEEKPRQEAAGCSRILDGIEKVGNKVPHPALIFLGLIVIVIVLSHDPRPDRRERHHRGRRARPVPVEPEYPGGTERPRLTTRRRRRPSPTTRSHTRDDHGQEPADRRRHPLHLHHGRAELQRLRRRRRHPRRDDRRRRRRGGRADRGADPQDGQGGPAGRDHLHHRAARRHLERRLRRRLPGADPARRGRVRDRSGDIRWPASPRRTPGSARPSSSTS